MTTNLNVIPFQNKTRLIKNKGVKMLEKYTQSQLDILKYQIEHTDLFNNLSDFKSKMSKAQLTISKIGHLTKHTYSLYFKELTTTFKLVELYYQDKLIWFENGCDVFDYDLYTEMGYVPLYDEILIYTCNKDATPSFARINIQNGTVKTQYIKEL